MRIPTILQKQLHFRAFCTILSIGDAGRPKWEAVFQPITGAGPYQITVTQVTDNCQVVLDDVLVGDVWVCSGQSNMQHAVERVNFCLSDKLLDVCYHLHI